MSDDLFTAMVKGDSDRMDEVDAVGEKAGEVHAPAIMGSARDVGHALRRASVSAIWAVNHQLDSLRGAVQTRIDEQADALKRSDPTTLPVLTDEDVAAHRATQVKAAE